MVITEDNHINKNRNAGDETDFERLYISSRQQEGRIYTDEQLQQLPVIAAAHPHYREWLLRKKSAARLLHYLGKKQSPQTILEVGCGNGWLANMLAGIKDSTVTGSDINKTELDQARRVFHKKTNLDFVQAAISSAYFEQRKFDAIFFAASIQYFPRLDETVGLALSLLHPGGEVHITDSHFYKAGETAAARERSLLHYQSSGHAAMAGFYFHHSIDALKDFPYTVRFDPNSLTNKLFSKTNVFPWISIQHP